MTQPCSLRRSPTLMSFDQLEDSFPVTMTAEEEKMAAKVCQAAADHGLVAKDLPIGLTVRDTNRLQLVYNHSTYKGKRSANEDRHTIVSTDYGDLFAICDGHGEIDRKRKREGVPQIGEEIAETVAKSIENDLLQFIRNHDFTTEKAFKAWADHVQGKMPCVPAGTTAVIGFFEKINHYFHVATVGDSEAVVFRMKRNKIHAIPLSTTNNWSTKKCVERVKRVIEPALFAQWEQLPTKTRRFPPKTGVNVACSFGDRLMEHNGQSAISHEPECSLLQLEEDDLIVLGCDGVFDFVTLEELIDEVIAPFWDKSSVDLADEIACYALNTKCSTDNVSVITARVQLPTSQLSRDASSPLSQEF